MGEVLAFKFCFKKKKIPSSRECVWRIKNEFQEVGKLVRDDVGAEHVTNKKSREKPFVLERNQQDCS